MSDDIHINKQINRSKSYAKISPTMVNPKDVAGNAEEEDTNQDLVLLPIMYYKVKSWQLQDSSMHFKHP